MVPKILNNEESRLSPVNCSSDLLETSFEEYSRTKSNQDGKGEFKTYRIT